MRKLTASRGRVTRLALFSALMRDTTPRGLKARSMTVALATGGVATGRDPPIGGICDKVAKFFQK